MFRRVQVAIPKDMNNKTCFFLQAQAYRPLPLEDVPEDVATAVCAAFGDKEPTVLEGKSSYNTFFM